MFEFAVIWKNEVEVDECLNFCNAVKVVKFWIAECEDGEGTDIRNYSIERITDEG